VYYPDIISHKNKIMMSIEVPSFIYLDKRIRPTPNEISHKKRLTENVVSVTVNLDYNYNAVNPKYAN
jgi:hypothetical protein